MDRYFSEFKPYRDGVRNDAITLSKAIKETSLNHDRLIIDEGIYKCGTIYLSSNCNIYLKKGAIIKLSDNDADFYLFDSKNKVITRNTWEDCFYNGKPSKYFIYGLDLENVTLDGEGVIDGSEELFYGTITKYHIEGAFYPRTPLIYIENSKNINILNLSLERSAFWTVHLVGCENVLIDSVRINNNPIFTNSDGIDPDHSKNVKIRNCIISCADDCIVLKTTNYSLKYGAAENIEISNCILKSTCAAIKIGTESFSDFKNIYVHDCNIIDTNRGISLMLRDGGSILNARFENIRISSHLVSPLNWWGRSEIISVTNIKRNNDSVLGKVDNVIFKNIKSSSENGVTIVGENLGTITLDNINLVRENKTNWPCKDLDLRPSVYNVLEGSFHDLYVKGNPNLIVNNCNFKDIVKE